MRNVEELLCHNIRQGFNSVNVPKDWTDSSGNTTIKFLYCENGNFKADVYLFNNLIASIRDKGFWIITGDCFHWWFSRTTFSRLNALINTFGIDPYKQGVYMRKKKPYLSTWGGDELEMSLNSSYWVHGVSLGWRDSK